MSRLKFHVGQLSIAYCSNGNKKKEMDVVLLKEIRRVVQSIYDQHVDSLPVIGHRCRGNYHCSHKTGLWGNLKTKSTYKARLLDMEKL